MATIEGVEIDLTPTSGMKEEAQRYRDWKADGEAGGTEVAARRANADPERKRTKRRHSSADELVFWHATK